MGTCIQNQSKRQINYLSKGQQTITVKNDIQTASKPKEKIDLVAPQMPMQPIQQEDTKIVQRSANSTHQTHSVHQSLLREVDRRKKPLRRQNYPLNSIGCLYFKNQNKGSSYLSQKEYFATGILISQNIVLTCAHFLDQYRLVGNQNLKFLLAAKNNQKFAQALQKSYEVSHFFICKDYRNDKQSLKQDYGIAVLKNLIVRQNHIALGIGFTKPQTEVSIYGYPYEDLKGSFDMKGMKGPLKQMRENIVLYDIDTESGQSGSPILLQYAQNLYFVIGIHLGKHNDDDFNSGILITNSLMQELHEWQTLLKDKQASLQTGSTASDTVFVKEKSSVRGVNFKQVQLGWQKVFENCKQDQLDIDNILKKQHDFQVSKYLPQAFKLYQQKKYHQSLCLLQSSTFDKSDKKSPKVKAQQIGISFYLQGLIYEKMKQLLIAQAFYTLCKKLLETIPKGVSLLIQQCYLKVANIMSQTGRKPQGKLLLQYRRAQSESILYENQKKMQSATTLIKNCEYSQAIKVLQKLKVNQIQHSSIPNQSKVLMYYRLSQAYLAVKEYSNWVENISSCLWMVHVLNIQSIAESQRWYNHFMKMAFDLRRSLDFPTRCKIGRAFKLLNHNMGLNLDYYCS